jgi:hypothetical protein
MIYTKRDQKFFCLFLFFWDVSLSGLELTILQVTECWDYKHVPPHLVFKSILKHKKNKHPYFLFTNDMNVQTENLMEFKTKQNQKNTKI